MRHRVGLACLVVAAALSPLDVSADTYPRQPAVDAVHYRFEITLTGQSSRIVGRATVTFRIVSSVAAIELDLVSPAGEKGMVVSDVTSGGQQVAFTHRDNRLRLPVPASLTQGQDISYTITYAGVPAAGLEAMTTMHGEPSTFSENWPDRARHWLPTIDHPYDKATSEMIVVAPDSRQVVSNGVLVEETDLDNGRRRTHWKQSVPIASWLVALAVSRFDVHHAGTVRGVPLQTWVYPQDRDAGRTLFEDTSRRAIEFFSDRVGPYPYEKLANVQAAGFGGGMENATAIFYGEKGVATGRAPVVHEIAHQWFGNSITERDWDDVWLSEGFATYFALLYTEHFEGREAFVRDLERSRATILELTRKEPGTPIVHRNLGDMGRVLNQFVYQKGGWFLHMLRQEVGDEAFWAGIRTYYQRYRDRNASTDDFRQVMEKASGKQLRWLFTQWLTRSGVPCIDLTWRYDPGQKVVELSVAQTQSGSPFRLPIDVAITMPGGDTKMERIHLDRARVTRRVPTPETPAAIALDPNTSLLFQPAATGRH